MREGAHQVPVARAVETVFRDQGQLGLDAAGVLEPDLVLPALPVRVAEPRGLGGLVVLDGGVVAKGQLDGVLVGDGGGAALPLDEGQGPVVAVVGHPQPELARGDLGKGVLHHPADVGQRGDGHGRAVGVAPLVWMVYLNTQAEKHWYS